MNTNMISKTPLTSQEEAPHAERILSARERAIRTQVREFFAADRGSYLAEWGVRITDHALVFHFFPPKPENEKEAPVWGAEFDMPTRLERALAEVFDTDKITCGYVDEESSFFVIAGGYGRGLDPRPIAERFLDQIDAGSESESA